MGEMAADHASRGESAREWSCPRSQLRISQGGSQHRRLALDALPGHAFVVELRKHRLEPVCIAIEVYHDDGKASHTGSSDAR